MSMLFIDGFDHYSNITRKWDSGQSTTFESGRNGNCIKITSTSYGPTKSVPATTNIVIGFAVYVQSVAISSVNFINFTNNAGKIHVYLTISNTGYVTARIKESNALLMTASQTIGFGEWHYFEIKLNFSSSVAENSCIMRIDGQVVGTVPAGASTVNSSSPTPNEITSIQIGGSNLVVKLDDLYIFNTSGTTNNDFVGDVKVSTIYPSGNGSYSQFLGSDGNSVDNYSLVNDANDATYVESGVSEQIDSYNFDNLSSNFTIYGIQTCVLATKDDAGSITFSPRINSGGDVATGSSHSPIDGSILCFTDVFETDPNTGEAWTANNINNIEAGFKIN